MSDSYIFASYLFPYFLCQSLLSFLITQTSTLLTFYDIATVYNIKIHGHVSVAKKIQKRKRKKRKHTGTLVCYLRHLSTSRFQPIITQKL